MITPTSLSHLPSVYSQKYLFAPVTFVKSLPDHDASLGLTDCAIVKTGDSQIHYVHSLASMVTEGVDKTFLAMLSHPSPNSGKTGCDDILALPTVTEPSLLHALRQRYSTNQIYTSVGPILISINPYAWIGEIYEEKMMEAYNSSSAKGTMAPHLFQVADCAYKE
ncbi:hypothetical protein ScalyP_jg1416, partial [Parmales sp. scaly parma]